jgi:hypothetical protein
MAKKLVLLLLALIAARAAYALDQIRGAGRQLRPAAPNWPVENARCPLAATPRRDR